MEIKYIIGYVDEDINQVKKYQRRFKKLGFEVVGYDFEKEMIERSAVKVKDSADAAEFLHSEIVLQEANEPRGRSLKRNELS